MICKHIEDCTIFKHYFADKPQHAQMIMDKYCKASFESCARYRLSCVIGVQAVPLKIFPDMVDVANQLISNADKKRTSDSSRSNNLIKSIQPEDVFDFALDLLAESTDTVMNSSYKSREQNLRKFSLWFKIELQNYYAKIIQIKIQHTGIRSRKRGKNPLTFFLENLRRNKHARDGSLPVATKPEDICAFHFDSLKVRIALFKGLKTKITNPDIVSSINSLLELEEERLKFGPEGIIKRFNDQNK